MAKPQDNLNSALYFGRVMHHRVRPFRHRFTYRVFSLFADLDELDQIGKRLPGFSHNRWNILSLWDRDLGPRDGSAPRPWIARQLAAAGLPSGGPVRVLCFPRVLGYVFNPITLWFCYDSEERLIAVLYEVSNTFGQHHAYLLPVEPGEERVCHAFDKHFYVSPFIEMTADYRIKLKAPDAHYSLSILEGGEEGRLLYAGHTGERAELGWRSFLRAAFGYPLLTFKIMGGIHWEALWLWMKGAKFHRRPAKPAALVSLVRRDSSVSLSESSMDTRAPLREHA